LRTFWLKFALAGWVVVSLLYRWLGAFSQARCTSERTNLSVPPRRESDLDAGKAPQAAAFWRLQAQPVQDKKMNEINGGRTRTRTLDPLLRVSTTSLILQKFFSNCRLNASL
jgi:hypothetical protein